MALASVVSRRGRLYFSLLEPLAHCGSLAAGHRAHGAVHNTVSLAGGGRRRSRQRATERTRKAEKSIPAFGPSKRSARNEMLAFAMKAALLTRVNSLCLSLDGVTPQRHGSAFARYKHALCRTDLSFPPSRQRIYL